MRVVGLQALGRDLLHPFQHKLGVGQADAQAGDVGIPVPGLRDRGLERGDEAGLAVGLALLFERRDQFAHQHEAGLLADIGQMGHGGTGR
ncbi:MAG: hypothetical protein WDN45_03230 [Caulobacteraceae bacterium]